jgi:hypothetical protein
MSEKGRETPTDPQGVTFSAQELDFLHRAVGNPDFAQAIRATLQNHGVFDNMVRQAA